MRCNFHGNDANSLRLDDTRLSGALLRVLLVVHVEQRNGRQKGPPCLAIR